MNRECGCKHMARNIGIDQISIKGVDWPTDRELNVQNALELLAGRDLDALKPLIDIASKSLNQIISDLAKIKQQLESLKLTQPTMNSTNIDMENYCPFNPKAEIGNEEPLYYISPLFKLMPDFDDSNKIDSDDYKILFYLKYNLERDGFNALDNINEILNGEDEEKKEKTHVTYGEEYIRKITNDEWKKKIKELAESDMTEEDVKSYLTEYDLQLVKKFIEDCENNVLYYKDSINKETGEMEVDALPLENCEDWFFFVDYINPWMSKQWPDINEDGKVDAEDATLILQISSMIGANSGKTIEIETKEGKKEINIKKWANQLNASVASRVLGFAAAAGAGQGYSIDNINDWKDYVLREEAGL